MNNTPLSSGDFPTTPLSTPSRSSNSVVVVGNSDVVDQLEMTSDEQSWELIRYTQYADASAYVESHDAACIVAASTTFDSAAKDFFDSVRTNIGSVPFFIWASGFDTEPLHDVLSNPNTSYVPHGDVEASSSALLERIDDQLRNQHVQFSANVELRAIETAMDGIAILDSNQQYAYVNSAHAEIFDYCDREDFVGNSWAMCYELESNMELKNDVVEHLAEHDEWSGELPARRSTGEEFFVKASFSMLDNGGMISVVREVVESKPSDGGLDFSHAQISRIINISPHPTVIVDAESQEITHSNTPANGIYGVSHGLRGTHLYDLAPERDRELADDLLLYILERHGDGSYRKYLDGTPIILENVEGQHIHVRIDAQVASINGARIVHLNIRPIQDRLEFEDTLSTFRDTVTKLRGDVKNYDIVQTAVDSAVSGFGYSSCGIYEYNEDSAKFQLLDSTGPLPDGINTDPMFGAGNSELWDTYRDNETTISEKSGSDPSRSQGGPRGGYDIFIPLRDEGVLFLSETTTAGPDETDVLVAELFATAIESSLARARKDKRIRELNNKVTVEREQTNYVNGLNEMLRVSHRGVFEADTYSEIQQVIVDQLTQFDDVVSAWICHHDRDRKQMVPTESAGAGRWYFDELDFRTDIPQQHISAQVMSSERSDSISNLASGPQNAPEWRRVSVDHGVRSIAAVPIVYNEVVSGVLVVESDQLSRFDSQTLSILTELGELVGFARNTINQEQSLMNEGSTELQFNMDSKSGILSEIAEKIDSNIFVYNTVPTGDDTHFIHCGVPDTSVSVSEFVEAASTQRRVANVAHIGEEPVLYEVSIRGETVPTTLGGHGVNARELIAKAGGEYQFKLTVPPNMPQGRFINEVKDYFSTSAITVDESTSSNFTVPWNAILRETLTDTQIDTLRTAYVRGYWESGGASGTEIGESLGVSQPAVSKRIRKSMIKLNEVLWGDSPRSRTQR